jgi:hypothetical protein
LPGLRIQRTDVRREIGFKKDPPTPRFGARNETALSPRTDLFRVHPEEFRSFIEVESLHGLIGPTSEYRRQRMECRGVFGVTLFILEGM